MENPAIIDLMKKLMVNSLKLADQKLLRQKIEEDIRAEEKELEDEKESLRKQLVEVMLTDQGTLSKNGTKHATVPGIGHAIVTSGPLKVVITDETQVIDFIKQDPQLAKNMVKTIEVLDKKSFKDYVTSTKNTVPGVVTEQSPLLKVTFDKS